MNKVVMPTRRLSLGRWIKVAFYSICNLFLSAFVWWIDIGNKFFFGIKYE